MSEIFTKFQAALKCIEHNETVLVEAWEQHLRTKHATVIKRPVAPKIDPKLLEKSNLLQLIDQAQWYEPMSNSSPSCPWYENMRHWGHEDSCPITELGLADNSKVEE